MENKKYMKLLEQIRQSHPEEYDRLLNLAVNLHKLPRIERRAVMRKILKDISKLKYNELERNKH